MPKYKLIVEVQPMDNFFDEAILALQVEAAIEERFPNLRVRVVAPV